MSLDGVLPKYRSGGQWNRHKIKKIGKRSVTPGKIKGETCSLTSIGGLPRKAFTKSRSYKLGKLYELFCNFSDRVNR